MFYGYNLAEQKNTQHQRFNYGGSMQCVETHLPLIPLAFPYPHTHQYLQYRTADKCMQVNLLSQQDPCMQSRTCNSGKKHDKDKKNVDCPYTVCMHV